MVRDQRLEAIKVTYLLISFIFSRANSGWTPITNDNLFDSESTKIWNKEEMGAGIIKQSKSDF